MLPACNGEPRIFSDIFGGAHPVGIYSRGRKIRCDGAKPVCHNCSRRSENPQLCSYDSAPKRRGPDRIPGARQRSTSGAGERPRRRRRPPQVETGEQPFIASGSASQSPVDTKSSQFSPTATTFMTDAPGSHPDHHSGLQTLGHGQYSRHRQDLPELGGRPSMPGGLGAHYAQHHDFVGSSDSFADLNAAAHRAHADPSGRL